MTVEELRIFINAIANKDQSGASMTPIEYNSYLARANEYKFKTEYGLRENPQNGLWYQNSQNSTDALNKFLTPTTISLGAGGFLLPSNYVHLSSVSTAGAKSYPITIVNEDEFDNILIDPIIFPVEKYPYGKIVNNRLVVAPSTVAAVNMVYLRKPVNPLWNWTVVNDTPVYDPATSVQIEWPDIYHVDIAVLILQFMGINFREEFLLQYAESTKQTGS